VEIVRTAKTKALIMGLYRAAQQCMRMARRYEVESGYVDARAIDCIRQVNVYRSQIRGARAVFRMTPDEILSSELIEDVCSIPTSRPPPIRDTIPAPATYPDEVLHAAE
jgi:hypothetical protein